MLGEELLSSFDPAGPRFTFFIRSRFVFFIKFDENVLTHLSVFFDDLRVDQIFKLRTGQFIDAFKWAFVAG